MAITATQGLPSAADLILAMDAVASILKGQYANIGLYGESETTTLAGLTRIARNKIMGDGTTTYPGLANTDVQKLVADTLKNAVARARYDDFFRQYQALFTTLDGLVRSNLPTGWNFSASAGNRPLDLWMLYLNGANASAPVTPTITPTLAAATGGSIGQTGVIRVKVCYQTSDWLVSLPSAASSTITLSGKNNAITVSLSGNAAVTGYVLVFRQREGSGAGDPYYFDQRVACTSGAAHPAITCKQSDQALRLDLSPPSFLSCMALPEEAFLFANAYAGPPSQLGAQTALFNYAASAFFSPANVTLNPTSGFAGVNNPASSAEFARWVATVFTEGTLATANDATNVIQGFAGAAGSGVQLRVTSALNFNAPITNVDYYWYSDAFPPNGAVQGPTTIAAPGTLNLGLGQTLDLGIPAGRLVTRISAMTVGTATTGTIVAESKALRTL